MLPDKFSFDGGLVRLVYDAIVLEMAQIGFKHRAIKLYVVRVEDTKQLEWELREGGKVITLVDCNRSGKKLTPRRASKVPLDILLQKETCGPHIIPTPSINDKPNISTHSNPTSTTPIHTTVVKATPQICEDDNEDDGEGSVGVTNEGNYVGSEDDSEDETHVASSDDVGSEEESYVDSELENGPPNIQNITVGGDVGGDAVIESEYGDTNDEGTDPLVVNEQTNFKRGAISGVGRNGRGKGAAGRGRGKGSGGSLTGRGRGRCATAMGRGQDVAMGDTQQLASSQVYSTQASIQSEQQ
ncbi:unnamed protein product [Amaranthus hypochondriacus]